MELRELFAAIRSAWWLSVAGAVAGAAIGLVLSLLQTPMYESHTQLFVSTTDSTSTAASAYQGSQFSEQRVRSYAELITGKDMAKRVIDRLDLTVTPDDLQSQVSAVAQPNTVLLDVTVVDAQPQRAQRIADTIATLFPDFVAGLEGADGPTSSPVRVSVTESPEVALQASSPRPMRYVAVGLVLGLCVGAAAAVSRARLDRSIRDPEQASALVGAPSVGLVLRDDKLKERHDLEADRPVHLAESFRRLRTNLQFLDVDNPPRVIMVSSALPGEGKTTVVVNLAADLANAGLRVVVVEADLRRPRVTRYLGMVSGAGLTNVLTGTADVEDVLQRRGTGGLSVIAAGALPPNPGDLLASDQMAALLEKLRAENDFVLVDSPPVLAVSDSPGLALRTDGVLLVVRYGFTGKEQVKQAAVDLDRVNAKTLGVVLNMVPPRAETASAYGYNSDYAPDAAD